MLLTVLGCSGSVPGPESPASGYLLRVGDTSVVLDLGNGTFGALQRYLDPFTLDGLILSHLHPDHCADVSALTVYRRYHPHPPPGEVLPVYGPPDAAERLIAAYAPNADERNRADLSDLYAFRSYGGATARIGPLGVLAARVAHTCAAHAVRVGIVRYAAPDPWGGGVGRLVPSEDHLAHPLAVLVRAQCQRLAAELGVELGTLKGSGPEGRIVKEDVLAAAGGRTGERRRPEAAPRPVGADVEVVEPSRMQATIARRMAESKSTVPEFQVTVEARVDQAVSLRAQLKESVPGADKVTMTDMLVRACALALRKFPEVNTSWVEGRFQRKRAINIGLAVAPSEGMGLLVPVVHDADLKDLIQISIESRQVIERARSGRPHEGDLSGATFSISNLGMYGVDEFVAIINPPEAAILAVGAIKDVPVVEDGRIVPGKVMRMTLSVDHRVFYGATAAQFMAEVRRLIENPVTLVVPPAR